MAEEPRVTLPAEEPRRCPACGTRVAARATTCLMCGVSLIEEEPAPEETEAGGLPNWARPLIVVGLALAILATGGLGLYTLITAEPVSLTPTPTSSSTPTIAPTPTSTQTPTPSPTPTPVPPVVHQVGVGETLSTIAEAHHTTVEAILALNPDVNAELLRVGQVLQIPAATPTPAPTDTPDPNAPTPTPPGFIIHIVAPGETLISIAEEYEVSVALIREVNDIPIDNDIIEINQSLVIPVGTPVPSPTPTVDPNATPTPIPPYLAPALLSPPDGAVFVGDDEPIALQWASVSVLRDNEWYEVALSHPSGGVVSVTVHTHSTAWRVPLEMLPDADVRAREFRWRVQIVREAQDKDGTLVYEGAGAASQERTFTWLEPTPTPTLPPTPTP
jgi:LysM repeat protein